MDFITRWKNHGDEISDTQTFWLELLHDLLGIEKPGEFIDFQKRVELTHVSFIDAYIPSTRIIIEQKSFGVDLTKSAKQSDGSSMTPYEQAKRYHDWLPQSQQGRFIVICDFQSFRVHDLEFPRAEPEIILLENLTDEIELSKLKFLVDVHAKTPREIREQKLSEEAGKLTRKFYECIATRYDKKKTSIYEIKRSLNILCTRLVFLLYAEDAGLFRKNQFHDYIISRRNTARDALIKLFEVLNQDPNKNERDPYIDDELNAFPFVNGGLFKEKDIKIPRLDFPDDEPLKIILEEMSEGFNWSSINPTIFGAIFESTLNEEKREEGGMHYTSIENIHKVIDPLFMNELEKEYEKILTIRTKSERKKKLLEFQKKLASLTFLDPACGSGNFLTESYISLRRLENKILAYFMKNQINFAEGEFTPVKVSIANFYGIEINDFAVAVARTALWIAEHQMMKETKSILDVKDDFLPLKTYGHIIKENALTFSWQDLISPANLNYIISNPPFYGHQWRKERQNTEMKQVFSDCPEYGKFDYVCSWYKVAADYIKGTKIKAVFVSTNSICQGELISTFWKYLRSKGIDIFLAYRPFMWDNKAEKKAHVHCVIVGITQGFEVQDKRIYTSPNVFTRASHINGYLLDFHDIYFQNRGKPLTPGMPRMRKGSQPTDGGHLILSQSERDELVSKYPEAEEFIRRYMSGRDFLYDLKRYCLWLVNVEPGKYRHIRPIRERLELVAEARRKSSTKSVQEAADTPAIFTQIRQPENNFMVIPEVTSELRQYIPMGFMSPEIIVSNKLQILPNADLFMFGVMESRVHTAWVEVVAGRLGVSYSYAPFVYNNFVWPSVSERQRAKIEACAKKILEARAKFPESTLADLYDPLSMPLELRRAHRENDKAVIEAYGFGRDMSEFEIVNELMKRYEALTIGDISRY